MSIKDEVKLLHSNEMYHELLGNAVLAIHFITRMFQF